MEVTGVGSHYVYLYNRETKKLATTDGSKNAFVDFYNGDRSEETLAQLNGFDVCIEDGIGSMMKYLQQAYNVGLSKKSPDELFGDSSICEVSVDVEQADRTQYYINGEKIMEFCVGVTYTQEEEEEICNLKRPFKTRESKGYNSKDNSINIAVGDVYNLGNGYRAVVKDDYVYCGDYGKGNEGDDRRMNHFVGALTCLIQFADHIAPAGFLDGYTSIILELLKELGVDTDREFIINGTKCEIRDGMIREVGSYNGVPGEIYEKALKRREEGFLVPLKEREDFAKYFNKN